MKTLVAVTLIVALISFATAQDLSTSQGCSDSVPQTNLSLVSRSHNKLQPPNFCKPCLFYAGDFDSNASDANGLANEVDTLISTGAAVYTPFIVPKGKTWTVTGLFTNNFLSTMTLDPKIIPYEIRKDIPKDGGNGGKLVCHGKLPGTLVDMHICFDTIATIVNNIKGCRLPAGKYWLSVVPYCTGSECGNWRSFVANDDGVMAHRYGPLEPANNSFFNSEFFGANWAPTTQYQSSARFSVGVEGTSK